MINKSSVALGFFDGLHTGHQSVIACALKQKERGLIPLILLFDEHPMKVLTGSAPKEILQSRLRDEILSSYGIEPVYISFSEIKDMTPEDFFYEILIKKLNAGVLCCGSNYHFGKDGKGDGKLLRELCRENDITLQVAPDAVYEGELISSTRIRRSIEKGDITGANKMLGRPFSFIAEVKKGQQRGRLIGAPTINQYFEDNFVSPKNGVYASVTEVDGRLYPSITNIGLRPSFENEDFRSETNIIGFDGDLYGREIKVGLLEFIREEKRFSGLSELKSMIFLDKKQAMKLIDELGAVKL